MEYLQHFRLIFLFFLAFLSYRHIHQQILPICQELEEEEETVRQGQEEEQEQEVEVEVSQEEGLDGIVPQQNAELEQEIVDAEENGTLDKAATLVEEISDCSSFKDNEESKREGKNKLIKKISKPKRKDPNPKLQAFSQEKSPIIIDIEVI